MTIVIRGARPEDRADWLRMRRTLWDDCPNDEHEREIDEIVASDSDN
jgi:aminoglycoside 6'-N-acetyltransferase I